MKRRVLAVMMAAVLCMAMSANAFAAEKSSYVSGNVSGNVGGNVGGNESGEAGSGDSSKGHSSSKSRGGSSSSSSKASAAVKTVGEVATETVVVNVRNADGSVSQSNLKAQAAGLASGFESLAVATAANGGDAGAALSAVLTRPASPIWQATINALGGQIKLNDRGAYNVKATALAADGSVIASAGVVNGACAQAFMILVGVTADGTMETVEGVYDVASGTVVGAFTNVPTVINAFIITAA